MNTSASGSVVPADALARLEARVRWLTSVCTFLTLAIVALVAWAFVPRSGEIQARRFVLRDDRWRRRAELTFRDDGGPALKLLGPEGRTNAALALDPDGRGSLKFAGADGKDRIRLGQTAQGATTLVLGDDAGLPGIAATTDAQGRSEIAIKKGGETLWKTP